MRATYADGTHLDGTRRAFRLRLSECARQRLSREPR